MFVLFIHFVLVLRVSISRATGNVALKDQLSRSITHVSDMLVDMEAKIHAERRILSQIDNNLRVRKGNDVPGVLRFFSTLPEYDGITDIWWTSPSTVAVPTDTTDAAGNTTDTVEDATTPTGNFTITFKTTASLFPRPPPESTYATHPTNWHLPTITTKSPFMEDLKKNMKLSRQGYFTAFAEKFTELIYTKDEPVAYPVVFHIALLMKQMVENGTFNSLGPDLREGLSGKLVWFDTLSPLRVKEQAGVLHYTLKAMDAAMPEEIKSLLRYYDGMFTQEEGHALFESLEPLFLYPQGNKTFLSMAEGILSAAITPIIKSEGTRKQRRLIQLILMATNGLDPHFRTQTMASRDNNDINANNSMKDHNQPAFPERRSMNYKKIIKHFLVKHPKLFRKIKRQYKHDKKKRHHRFSHGRKHHHNHNKSSRHQRHKDTTRQKAYIESSYEPQNEKIDADSRKSGAYYRENSKTHHKKNINKVKRTQKSKIQLNKLKRRNAKPTQWHVLTGTRSTTEPYRDDPQYLKQLAIRFLKNKQQRKKFYRNRRFNIPSSEEEICNHSQNFKDSIENDILHKIRDASSYSDEENHLRINLYDALRHGNRTFASFRKSDGGKNNIHTVRALSSETDEEWVLKNNIYKVFEHEKE